MTKWIERYRRQAEERYRRLDDVLRALPDDPEPTPTGPDDRSTTMTIRTHQTEIVADPDVPLVRITREFDAAAREACSAPTPTPSCSPSGSAPAATRCTVDHYDCRTGGSYRYVLASDGEEYGFHGCFHDVRPSELIVQTFTFEGLPDEVALERLVFEDLGDGRSRLDGDVAGRQLRASATRSSPSGMEDGVREGYERLDEVLAG